EWVHVQLHQQKGMISLSPPTICNSASISEVFPDFYLLDTKSDKPFPMEVFGMATPAYLARKQLKKDYYNREYGPYGWWHWDATTASETMVLPHFPESRKPLSTDTPA
ncbi:hypothetical protein O3W73_24915, partial [Salmonella enterica subsp. enterica serovar 4,[5],12:i:-]